MRMPTRTLPRIANVTPSKTALALDVRWQDGAETRVDVSDIIRIFRALGPLRTDRALFEQVRVGEHGTDVAWTDEIDISADTLWRLAQEQSGQTLSAAAFRAWRERKAYTLHGAARALGLSRRMVAYYKQGEKPIPRVVALATQALEMTG
jgi:hypothetical protein